MSSDVPLMNLSLVIFQSSFVIEARGGESDALRMICRANLMKAKLVDGLIDQNQPLCRILNSTAKTAKAKKNGQGEAKPPKVISVLPDDK